MKRFVILALVGCILALVAADVFAWELKLKGVTEYRYRYLTRFGANDLFGDTGLAPVGINHIKQWTSRGTWNSGLDGNVGIYAGEPRFGADNNEVAMRATLYPTIIVNKAIKVGGAINLTSLGLHGGGGGYFAVNPGYYNSNWVPINDRMAGNDVPNMMVTTDWWKISVKMPMMNLSLGTKQSGAGLGLWKHKCMRASTSFGMSASYGPFGISFSPYLGRSDSDWGGNTYRDSSSSNTMYRKEDIRDYFRGLSAAVKYKSGPLEMGIIKEDGYVVDQHGTVIFRNPANGAPGFGAGGSDRNKWSQDMVFYMKYANGRFFFNTEVDHFWQYESGRALGVGSNQDAWMYAVELGVLAGPMKLTGSYIRATGDDISTRETTEDAGASEAGVSACFIKHWAYLMEYRYGTGSGFDAEGYGSPTNFYHVGGKIDYAVAANLNVFALGVGAWRDTPQSFRWGGNGLYGLASFNNGNIPNANANFLPVPTEKDFIGWEVDAGFDWQLLENMTWHMLFAYWQPGNWWGYALPNSVNVFTAGGTAAPVYTRGANYPWAMHDPERTFDPLFAIESTLSIHF